MRRWLAVPLLICAGCGATSTTSSSIESATGVPGSTTTTIEGVPDSGPAVTGLLPATTLFVQPTVGSGPLVLPEPITVSEPCPDSVAFSISGDASAPLSESSRLEPMLGAVVAYGGEHPDSFGSYGLIWHSETDASVFISFAGELAGHRTALSGIVEFPEELIVCQVALPGQASQALSAALTAELAGRYLSISQGGGPIAIALPATEEALARDLFDRYGEAVQLTVGALAYPIDEASSVCQEPVGEPAPAELEVSIVPPTGPLGPDAFGSATFEVQLTNLGEAPIQFTTGTARGTILDSNGNVVATSANLALTLVGIGIDLAPGASTVVPGVVAMASCDPRLGYVLPPGDYGLVASLSRSDTPHVRTPAQPITVAAP